MKKALFFFLMLPLVASANQYMGNCKKQYDDSYKLMMIRQQNVPMHVMIEAVENQKPEDYDILTDSELTLFYEAKEETIKLIERAYIMPNMGFMDSAAHQMAVEFANHQYLRCTRAKRK